MSSITLRGLDVIIITGLAKPTLAQVGDLAADVSRPLGSPAST
jgi:hypothetical protein